MKQQLMRNTQEKTFQPEIIGAVHLDFIILDFLILVLKYHPISNFNGIGPDPLVKTMGINYFGASDMAGNVREWCWNKTRMGKIICGGA